MIDIKPASSGLEPCPMPERVLFIRDFSVTGKINRIHLTSLQYDNEAFIRADLATRAPTVTDKDSSGVSDLLDLMKLAASADSLNSKQRWINKAIELLEGAK